MMEQMAIQFLTFKGDREMKILLLAGVINGFLAVALGAFGAHGLEGKLTEKQLDTWGKAVDYQMFHTAAILAVGLLMTKFQAAQ